MKADWSATDAARQVCEALSAQHGIQSPATACGAIAFALDCYARYHRDREPMRKSIEKTRRELLVPLENVIEAIKNFELDRDCQQTFSMSQRDLWEKLEDLHRLIDASCAEEEERYRKPAHRAPLEREDRLIMELARAFSNDLQQPLETLLAKGQTGFNPAFIAMLEAAHKAFTGVHKPCQGAGEFVRRAKRNRRNIVAEAPTFSAWPLY